MIREAVEKDKAKLYELWRNSFSHKTVQALDFFMKNGIKEGKTVISEMDDKLVASAFLNEMNIMFHNKCLKATFLSHATAHPDYRKSGALDDVLKSVLDECEKKSLFTFVEATSYKFWENYGFQEAVIHRFYELNQHHFENVSVSHVFEDANAEELKEVYDQFISHFDGYKCTTVRDFENMIEEAKACQERILVTRHFGKVQGYIRFSVDNHHVRVKELVYLGSNAMQRLCKAALGQREVLELELSEAEHLEKLYPLALPRKRVAIMVRCNNFPLFNKLYNAKVKTSRDAFMVSKKPKYMNEKY